MLGKSGLAWGLGVLCGVVTVAPAVAEMGNALATRPAPLYREPKAGAEILGTYPSGTRMRVFLPVRSGWYALGFAQPYKGARYAWIPAWALTVEEASPSAKAVANSPVETGKNWIAAGGDLFLMAPADFQASVLEVAGTSVLAIGFGAEYGRRLGRWFSVAAKAGFYSFSQVINSGVATSLAYSASGFWAAPFLGLHFIDKPSLSLALRLGAGISVNTVGNTSTAEEISTTSILGFPIQAKLSAQFNFYEGWGFHVDAGYQLHSLRAVPILAPPAYSSADAQAGRTTTAVTLSAPVFSVGLSYQF